MILTAPERPKSGSSVKTLNSIELFAGAGGLSLGIHAAGFQHRQLVEFNQFAVETLRENSQRLLNLSPDGVTKADVATVDFSQYVGQLDLLAGGPPCQPFSMAGKSVGQNDSRNMFPIFLDIASQVLPKSILIENVRGLLRKKFEDYFRYILLRTTYPLCRHSLDEHWTSHYVRLMSIRESEFLDSESYNVTYQLVDAADYGIAQRRERVIITAYRRDLGIAPGYLQQSHSRDSLYYDQNVGGTYWTSRNIQSRSQGLPIELSSMRGGRQEMLLTCKPWKTVRDVIGDLPSAVDRGECPLFPNHVQHPGARVYECHTGSSLDMPAKALKAGTHGTPGGENMIRLEEGGVRYFTTREAARIQAFPDDWVFHGTWGACIKQLGNAVPVELARKFASEIYLNLTK